MARKLLPLLLFSMAGCSQASGPEADLQYIKQARSLAAEWALVNDQVRHGSLTPTYVGAMHQWLRDNLQTTSTSLTQPDSAYGRQIQALLAEPDDSPGDEIRAHSEKLKQIEDSLESA